MTVADRVVGRRQGALDQGQRSGLDGVDGPVSVLRRGRAVGRGRDVGERAGVEVGLGDGVEAVQVIDAPGSRLAVAGQVTVTLSSATVNGPVRVTLPVLVTR